MPGLREAAADDRAWTWMTTRDTDSWIAAALAATDAFHFVVLRDGVVVGSTSYLSVVPEHRRLEIGTTGRSSRPRSSAGSRRRSRLRAARYPTRDWSRHMNSVTVIGRGRVGSAVAARLEQRGVELRSGGAEFVLLCVPDRAIGEVARSVEPGPWVAHVSGATPLAELDPHERRFSMHPLQTFTHDRGPEQLDGAWAAVTAETEEARTRGWELAETLGVRPFDLADDARTLYHAGASIASNYLVTLYRAASRLFEDAGAPPAGLVPLMTRTIENGFELTGPISRGDWAVVEAHLAALHEEHPELEPMYRVLAEATVP